MAFDSKSTEEKWSRYWKENNTYKVSIDHTKPKYYILDMFPYPSGSGLHVGHPLGYIASDIYARYKTMMGFNVLHPMGFDSFGLPAEQYAVQMGVHPAKSTDDNIAYYQRQLNNLGVNYDWERSVVTSDPLYYKWTQWIFTLLFDHYYDPISKSAMPIPHLIELFSANGCKAINAFHTNEKNFTAAEWDSMTPSEKDDVLMNYRLAYRKVGYVNWCEELGTVLANDEVKDGLSERGGHPVVQKAMMQWSLRITAYADRLLEGMKNLDWSSSLKAMQENWIGRSEGAQVFFEIEDHDKKIEVFTTRPDTIYGSTFMVLAPEHKLVTQLTAPSQQEEIEKYIESAKSKSQIDRMSEVKEISGAFTGSYAINPFTDKKIPIWIGDYVLSGYGTGAIMAVPSEDDRDHRFAEKFQLEVIQVVDKSDFPDAEKKDKVGVMINSDEIDGMQVEDAVYKITKLIEDRGLGQRKINYKLHDANYSRQRYWGEPFPILYSKDGTTSKIDLDNLPVELPELSDFKSSSDGRSPLAKIDEWIHPTSETTRESDTMPGYAGSSWYFLRYMDAMNDERFVGEDAIDYWQDVDLYIGGTEHAVGHLMYSRFWHKFLYDIDMVPTDEPFKRLVNQGMIQGVIEYIYLYKDKVEGKSRFLCAGLVPKDNLDAFIKIPIHIDFVMDYGSKSSYLNKESINQFIIWRPEYVNAIFECSKGTFRDGKFYPKDPKNMDSRLVTHSEIGKMSKRYFNVVNPDDVIEDYGADCFRLYEMFLGPIEQSKPWDTQGIDGVAKFLKKFWHLFHNAEGEFDISDDGASEKELKTLHYALKKVTDYIEKLSFNTAISSMMICVNDLRALDCNKKEILDPLVRTLAPFAPFMTEELWSRMGNTPSVHHAGFPLFEEKHLQESAILYPLCINGKKRTELSVPTDLGMEEIEQLALNYEMLGKWIEGKEVRKVIVVPGRMINIVV